MQTVRFIFHLLSSPRMTWSLLFLSFIADSSPQSGPSEATPTSTIQTSRDPRDLVLDAPFGVSSYGPIQRPGRMSEVWWYLAVLFPFYGIIGMHAADLFSQLISP